MDPYCREILTILMSAPEGLGFNELAHKAEYYFGFSRPTLSNHLKHLAKDNLIICKKDMQSNFPLKPSNYQINQKALEQYRVSSNMVLSMNEKRENLLKKANFKQLAWQLLRQIYYGDLVLLKLYLEMFTSKTKESKRFLFIARTLMESFMDTTMFSLIEIAKKAQKKEIMMVLKEFEIQIKRSERTFESGKVAKWEEIEKEIDNSERRT